MSIAISGDCVEGNCSRKSADIYTIKRKLVVSRQLPFPFHVKNIYVHIFFYLMCLNCSFGVAYSNSITCKKNCGDFATKEKRGEKIAKITKRRKNEQKKSLSMRNRGGV